MKDDLHTPIALIVLAIVPLSLTLWLTRDKASEPIAKPLAAPITGVSQEKPPVVEAQGEAPVIAPREVLPDTALCEEPPFVKPQENPSAKPARPAAPRVPVFSGFEAARYQQYDALIARLTDEFNRNRAKAAAATPEQARRIGPITVEQVKAHMIQESGGDDARSRAAWRCDPLQVNVPGDWTAYKRFLGLRKPRRRNEGSLETNLRAGIRFLARKGFGTSGQPAANCPTSVFDGWKDSLRRYNGRVDPAADGRAYRDHYAEKILRRAARPSRSEPIQIKTKKK